MITHSPMPGGSDDGEISPAEPIKVARCRISFDKDLGAVALAMPGHKNKDNNDDDTVNNAGPILFVADVVGRLWRSTSRNTSALAYSEGHIDTKADNSDAAGDNGPFEMIECSGKTISGRKVRRCLPLGVDLMSIRPRMGRLNDDATDGTFLVAAGSQSIQSPAIVYVPNDIAANVLVEEVAGTEAMKCQIVSVLFVSRDSVGNAWKRLLSGHYHSMLGASPGYVSQADSAVLFGMSDGSIYCALVSSVYANDEAKQVTSFNIEPAVPMARLQPQQSVISMFLAPKASSSTCCQSPDSLLVCVGCLGTVAVLDWTSTDSNNSVFVSTSDALPRLSTWTSAAPFQCYHSTKPDTSNDGRISRGSVKFTILATCDDGSTYTCQLTLKECNGYCKLIAMQTARRLPIRKDVASASTLCVPNNTNNVDGMYIFTFKGSLLGFHVEEENKIQRAAANGKSFASDSAIVALKRLCEASLDTRVDPLREAGTNENVVNAMIETRNAERIISLNSESSSLGNDSGANSARVKSNWFRTSHVHQSMLADVIDSQQGMGKDLALLYFEENGDRGKRTKVTYAGATRNHCSSLDNFGDHGYIQGASLWNRRAFLVNASLASTFEQSIDAGILMVHHGERISNGRKRKFIPSLMPVGLAESAQFMQHCIGKRRQFSNGEHEVFGLVASAKIDLPARWSTLDDVVSGMLENDSPTSCDTVGRNAGGAYFANTERSLIKGDSAVRTGNNAGSKLWMANQSIFLSSHSAIAKSLSREGSTSDGVTLARKRMYGLDSVSLAAEAQQSNDSWRNLRYSIETSNAGTKEYVCSTLPLLRSCIVGMLAKRLEAPGHQTSFPDLSELEAANLLDSYHQAVKNPRTKKMVRYLATKVGECLAALKSDGDDDANNNGKGSSLLLADATAVMTLYNQVRAIPLPLG